jgi:hypothetical protein
MDGKIEGANPSVLDETAAAFGRFLRGEVVLFD